jgi:hypothetical protein
VVEAVDQFKEELQTKRYRFPVGKLFGERRRRRI